jgi:hypothetical protein
MGFKREAAIALIRHYERKGNPIKNVDEALDYMTKD